MRVPSPGHGVNSTPLPFYSPGITIKGALTVRFSDLTLFRRMTTRQLASSSLCAKLGRTVPVARSGLSHQGGRNDGGTSTVNQEQDDVSSP
jgi:hypothetical protein